MAHVGWLGSEGVGRRGEEAPGSSSPDSLHLCRPGFWHAGLVLPRRPSWVQLLWKWPRRATLLLASLPQENPNEF